MGGGGGRGVQNRMGGLELGEGFRVWGGIDSMGNLIHVIDDDSLIYHYQPPL